MRRALLIITVLVPALGVEAQDSPNPLTFEVASIKERTADVGRLASSPDRWTQANASLRDLIEGAYYLQRYEIVGGPAWITGSIRFDVIAKASFVPSPAQMRLMAQQLLAARFMLRVRRLPGFE